MQAHTYIVYISYLYICLERCDVYSKKLLSELFYLVRAISTSLRNWNELSE